MGPEEGPMLVGLFLLASAPLPLATAEELRVVRELERLHLSAYPRHPGGPIVSVCSLGHPPREAIGLLESLPSLEQFTVGLPADDDLRLDLSRLARLRSVRLPSQYLDVPLKLPPGVRELSLDVIGRGVRWYVRRPDQAEQESAEVVRLVASLPRLETLDVGRMVLTKGWERRLSSPSLRRLSIDGGLPDLSQLPALEDLTVGRADGDALKAISRHAPLRALTVRSSLDDAALAVIGRMTRLQRLSLDHRGFTDRGLAALRGLTELRELRLFGTSKVPQVGDAGLLHLRGLRRLERVELHYTRLTDAGLAAFATLPRLRELSLEGNRVTGTGLGHLSGLPIERLFLGNEPLKAEGLRHLAALPRLRDLDLSSSGEGLDLTPGLAGVRQLQVLCLNYTGATDAGLTHLAAMKALRQVRLQETRVTTEAVNRLRRSRPELDVHRREPGK
jgi:hypothetical protein